ncbi:hypothetical protein Tco_0656539 [Tanacetum coccineum]|uniref:Retrovirus-related Pol polyprotein from transposon TNT 1-94-like beta-barrel domain-containing protein n=1 Tax=Tanacetum coccineum TaxID=301880 RepID=A0ABQ4X912_9ASTR
MNRILSSTQSMDNLYLEFSDEGILKLNELTNLVTKLSERIGVLEDDLRKTKKTYSSAFTKLILRVKKLEARVKIGKARRRAKVVLSDEDVEDDYSKQGRKLTDAEVQEKASTETKPFIQEVTSTKVIQDQGSSEKGCLCFVESRSAEVVLWCTKTTVCSSVGSTCRWVIDAYLEIRIGSAEASTNDNGEVQITATIDGHSMSITEATLRRHLKLDDQDGVISIPNSEIFKQLALMRYHTNSDKPTKGYSGQEVALFPTMLDVSEPSTSPSRITSLPSHSHEPSPSPEPPIEHTPAPSFDHLPDHTTAAPTQPSLTQPSTRAEHHFSTPCELPLQVIHSHGSDEGSLKLNELTNLVTKLSERIRVLEDDLRKEQRKVWDFNQHIEPIDMEHGSEKMKSPEKIEEEVVKESGAKRKKSSSRNKGDGSSKNYKVLSEMLEDFYRQDVDELRNKQEELFTHKEEMAPMALSDSKVNNDKSCSKTCLTNYEALKKQYDDLLVKLDDTSFNASTYKRGHKEYLMGLLRTELEKVKEEKEGGGVEMIHTTEFNEYGPRDSSLKPNTVCDKESDNSKENTDDSLKQQQKTDSKTSFVKSPLKADKDWKENWVSDDEDEVEPIPKVEKKTVIPTATKKDCPKTSHPSAYKHMAPRVVLMKTGLKSVNTARPVNTVRQNVNNVRARGDLMLLSPQHVRFGDPSNPMSNSQLNDKGFVDSGCSRHMIRNIAHLLDFKDFYGGYVTFGGGAYGGRITGKCTIKTDNLDFDDVYFVKELKFNLFSVSQMCDKKNYVLFTDSKCLVLSPNFKLSNENQILLKIPRQDNMYSFDMKNIVPKDSLTCLVAKSTSEESMLWQRRLGHKKFKNINTASYN